MAEVNHARARMACLGGLAVQLAAFVGLLALSRVTLSHAMNALAWFVLGGGIVWLAALLVSRQRELVVLEERDLEQLRREKQALGADAGIFDAEAGADGFRIAEARLRWMLRWLLPAMGLATSAYLIAFGLLLLSAKRRLGGIAGAGWEPLAQGGVGLVVTSVIMFVLFMYSRYAAGMGRVPEWQLLRAGGSYMLGNTLLAFALIICLGLQLWDESLRLWERGLAYVIPAAMIVLGAEIILNFIADIYRPRTEGAAPRACFDSRLLGLISEPGGIAHSIAEAINYQFGFKVSQTWFYQLLQRTFVPLVACGALVLWLMSGVLVVNPGEQVIVERFGRLVNADRPLEPGLSFKLPWPLAVAHRHPTGRLEQIVIGAKFKAPTHADEHEEGKPVLWTDSEHAEEHFNFLVAINPFAAEAQPATAPTGEGPQRPAGRAGVNILRMGLAVQYRVDPARVADHLLHVRNPQKLVEDVAWRELVRFAATLDIDALLGDQRAVAGEVLRERIRDALAGYRVGIDVVYVGLQDVHPEATVAQAFQDAVIAAQTKIARIRQAQVNENQVLSNVAGDKERALALVEAIEHREGYESILTRMQPVAGAAPARVAQSVAEDMAAQEPLIRAMIESQREADRARRAVDAARQELELGMAGSPAQLAVLERAAADALAERQRAAESLEQAVRPIRDRAAGSLSPEQVDALVRLAEARIGIAYWDRQLESLFVTLGGDAARIIAEAHARRWQAENRAAAELARVQNEREAYHAAPALYKARRYLEVMTEGLTGARKYFLAFDPGERDVRIRVEAQQVAGMDLLDLPTKPEQ